MNTSLKPWLWAGISGVVWGGFAAACTYGAFALAATMTPAPLATFCALIAGPVMGIQYGHYLSELVLRKANYINENGGLAWNFPIGAEVLTAVATAGLAFSLVNPFSVAAKKLNEQNPSTPAAVVQPATPAK